MAHTLTGAQPPRAGNRDPLMAPHNCYRTAPEPGDDRLDPDPGRWLTIACPDDDSWRALATELGGDLDIADLAADPRFADADARKANEDELDDLIAGWAAGRDRGRLTERLQGVGVAAYPSMSPQELLADEHLDARGFFERFDHPEVGTRTHTGLAWRSATGPDRMPRRAPLIGEHTEEILGRLLGLTAAEVDELRRSGAIG